MARTDVYREVVRKSGSSPQKMAQRRAIFTKGYLVGTTKRSIKLELGANGLEARVKAATNYFGYLEAGTRKTEAQPLMQPASNEVQSRFVKDLRRAGIIK